MPSAGNVTMTGLPETIRALRGLMRMEVQEQISREIDSVARPVIVQAKANIIGQDAIRTGGLFDSMITVPKINPLKETISVIAGPGKRKTVVSMVTGKRSQMAATYKNGKRTEKPSKYAHLVEFGTRPHVFQVRTRKGIESFAHPGARARPFLGPAFDVAAPTMTDDIGRAVGRVIEAQATAATKPA